MLILNKHPVTVPEVVASVPPLSKASAASSTLPLRVLIMGHLKVLLQISSYIKPLRAIETGHLVGDTMDQAYVVL